METGAILVKQVDYWECISRTQTQHRQGLIQKSKLAQHTYEEGHQMLEGSQDSAN
jgi:hypothetical protein